MPELPEVETVCRSLKVHLLGRTITDVKATVSSLRTDVNLPKLKSTCIGQVISNIRRRAKYIFVTLSDNNALILHFGMTGACRICPVDDPIAKHDRIVWSLSDNTSWRFVDPRRFGSVQTCPVTALNGDSSPLPQLGPEPLGNQFNGSYLYDLTRSRTRAIKNLVMDQKFVVGVGNIYANEALFCASLRPQRQSGSLSRRQCDKLVSAIKAVLTAAIAAGGTTISDFRSPDGTEGHFQVQLQVYGKTNTPCPNCGDQHPLKRIVIGGRSSFYCPNCQR